MPPLDETVKLIEYDTPAAPAADWLSDTSGVDTAWPATTENELLEVTGVTSDVVRTDTV